MYAVIFKESNNKYVILDAYYKGRWSADKNSLIVYLNYLSLHDKFGKKTGNIQLQLMELSEKYNIDKDKTDELLMFFKANKLPKLCNFDAEYLIAKLDEFTEGIITPPTPILEVTPYCNYRCPWCYIPTRIIEQSEFFNDQELVNHIIQPLIERYGLLEWCLTGGEPTVQPERTEHVAELITEESIKILGKKPVSIYLLTNGYNLASNIDRFHNVGINSFQVALSSPNAQKENMLRRTPEGVDSYKNAIEGIKAVVERGLRAEINMIIQPIGAHAVDNLYDIPDMVELAKELKIKMLRIIPAVPCGQANENNIWMTKKEYDEVRKMVHEGRERIPEIIVDCPIDQEIEPDRDIYCRAGTLWLYIDFKGRTYPCNNIQNDASQCYDKTIREIEVNEIWEKSHILKSMRDYNVKSVSEECIKCNMRVECAGECRAMTWARYQKYDLSIRPKVCFKDLNMQEARGY